MTDFTAMGKCVSVRRQYNCFTPKVPIVSKGHFWSDLRKKISFVKNNQCLLAKRSQAFDFLFISNMLIYVLRLRCTGGALAPKRLGSTRGVRNET